MIKYYKIYYLRLRKKQHKSTQNQQKIVTTHFNCIDS